MSVWPYSEDVEGSGLGDRPMYLTKTSSDPLGQEEVRAFVVSDQGYVVSREAFEQEGVADCPQCCEEYEPPQDFICPGNCDSIYNNYWTVTATVKCRRNGNASTRGAWPACDSWVDVPFVFSNGTFKGSDILTLPRPGDGPPCGMSVTFTEPLSNTGHNGASKILVMGYSPPDLPPSVDHKCKKIARLLNAGKGWCPQDEDPEVIISAGFRSCDQSYGNLCWSGYRPDLTCDDCNEQPMQSSALPMTNDPSCLGTCMCDCNAFAFDEWGRTHANAYAWPGDNSFDESTKYWNPENRTFTPLGCFTIYGSASANCLSNRILGWRGKNQLFPPNPGTGEPIELWQTCEELGMPTPSARNYPFALGYQGNGFEIGGIDFGRGDAPPSSHELGVIHGETLGVVQSHYPEQQCVVKLVGGSNDYLPYTGGPCGGCNTKFSREVNQDPPLDCDIECWCGSNEGTPGYGQGTNAYQRSWMVFSNFEVY
jgi:hypothetical protein|tara:strand:+ start:4022 stop:5464 length:1443 start_codon:yes stop_codon:yes gene_type:complete